jgi:heme/copper-type cytochrome/quinol oxidase subunit 2
MNPATGVDKQFVAIVVSAAVLLGILSLGDLGYIGVSGGEVPSPQVNYELPQGAQSTDSLPVYENPPLPSEFPGMQPTTTDILVPPPVVPVPPVALPLTVPSRTLLGLKIFEITATLDGFSPATIVVSSGDRIQLDVTAMGARIDIGIPRLSTYLEVPEGETRSASFDAGAPGEYPFACRGYCPNGKEISGMVVVR